MVSSRLTRDLRVLDVGPADAGRSPAQARSGVSPAASTLPASGSETLGGGIGLEFAAQFRHVEDGNVELVERSDVIGGARHREIGSGRWRKFGELGHRQLARPLSPKRGPLLQPAIEQGEQDGEEGWVRASYPEPQSKLEHGLCLEGVEAEVDPHAAAAADI